MASNSHPQGAVKDLFRAWAGPFKSPRRVLGSSTECESVKHPPGCSRQQGACIACEWSEDTCFENTHFIVLLDYISLTPQSLDCIRGFSYPILVTREASRFGSKDDPRVKSASGEKHLEQHIYIRLSSPLGPRMGTVITLSRDQCRKIHGR